MMIENATPFGDAALELCRHGLAVVPAGGPDGKQPLVAWRKWKRAPRENAVQKLVKQFPAANVGVICGLSDLTVVDVDDSYHVAEMIRRCGDTPLKTATPSGGVHLWYRHAGEPCMNLRAREGLPADVKGVGGFVVAPPSMRPAGRFAGRRYELLAGSWNNLGQLPQIRANALAQSLTNLVAPRSVIEGRRNDALFRFLLRHAAYCDTEQHLIDVAQTINDDHNEPPLPEGEVRRTAASVWRYEAEGRNWVGREARAVIRKSELQVLSANPDALALWLHLKICHGARAEPFAISPKAMAQNETITGWHDPRRYSKVRGWLVDQGFLEVVHAGGTRPGDMWLYRLSSPA